MLTPKFRRLLFQFSKPSNAFVNISSDPFLSQGVRTWYLHPFARPPQVLFVCWFTQLKQLDPPICPESVNVDAHQWAKLYCAVIKFVTALLGTQHEMHYLFVPAIELCLEFTPRDVSFIEM